MFELNEAMLFTNTAKEEYTLAKQQGMAGLDCAAVFKLWQE
ncbi:hypothetical protein [Neptunitalea chrysea]|nr:hypothetical protein [Neptunitalea chrysea]